MLTLTLSAIFALYKCMLLFIITMFQFDVVVFCFFRLERVFLCNIFEERKKSNFVALTFHRREPKKEKKKHRKRDNAFKFQIDVFVSETFLMDRESFCLLCYFVVAIETWSACCHDM